MVVCRKGLAVEDDVLVFFLTLIFLGLGHLLSAIFNTYLFFVYKDK